MVLMLETFHIYVLSIIRIKHLHFLKDNPTVAKYYQWSIPTLRCRPVTKQN